MAVAPNPEPFRSICLKQGLLSKEQAAEVSRLQIQLTKELGQPQDFLELSKQRNLLTDHQVQFVKNQIKKQSPNSESERIQRQSVKELAGFQVIGKIGVGAMGAVYKVRQKSLDRVVALKILPPKLAKNKLFVERFKREARASAALNHPNIVQGIDVGEDQGLHYFAMEFIEGETVGQRFKRNGPLPLKEILVIGHQTALALAHAHNKGLIHRDIKPDNIMLTETGPQKGLFSVKLMDLGLARTIEGSDASMTQTGTAVGTPYYISPEQASGDKNLSAACDLYGLSGTLIHVYTGRPPFQGESSAVVMAKHITDPPPNLRTFRKDMPVEVAAILQKLLAKNPKERYASAEDLAEDFERIQKGQQPKHVNVAQVTGKSTGPKRPITATRAKPVGKTTKSQRPVNKRGHSRDEPDLDFRASRTKKTGQSGTVMAIAAASLLAVLGFGLFISSRSKTNKTKKTTQTSGWKDKSKTQLKKDRQAILKEAEKEKKTQTERAAQKKELSRKFKVASDAALLIKTDFAAQEKIWDKYKKVTKDPDYIEKADQQLALIQEKRIAKLASQLNTLIQEAHTFSEKQDFDAALAFMVAARLKAKETFIQAGLQEESKKIESQAKATGQARLTAAKELQDKGDLKGALEIYRELASFKFKPVSTEGLAKAAQLDSLIADKEKHDADRVTQMKFASILKKLHDFVRVRDFSNAQDLLQTPLKDSSLASHAALITLLAESVTEGPETLFDQIKQYLKLRGRKGLRIPGDERWFYGTVKFKNKPLDIQYKMKLIPQATPVTSFDWPDLFILAGFNSENPNETPNAPEASKLLPLGILLALAGEEKWARQHIQSGLTKNKKLYSKEVQASLKDMLSTLNAISLESGAEETGASIVKAMDSKNWEKSSLLLTNLVESRYWNSSYVKSNHQQLAIWAIKIRHKQAEEASTHITLDQLVNGAIVKKPNQVYELIYDFSDPDQLKDFVVSIPGWKIKDGALTTETKPGNSMIWLNIPFKGKIIQVIYHGIAPGDLNALLGPEISNDTLGGYSFRFGEGNNKKSCLLSTFENAKNLPKIAATLKRGAVNRVTIYRNGDYIEGTLNQESPLKYKMKNPQPTRYVALQSWMAASYSYLKITGRVDFERLHALRTAKALAAQPAPTGNMATLLLANSKFKGKHKLLEDGRTMISYAFDDPAELKDFEVPGPKAARIEAGKINFSAGKNKPGFYALHKGTWSAPFAIEAQIPNWSAASKYYMILMASPENPELLSHPAKRISIGITKEKLFFYRDSVSTEEKLLCALPKKGNITIRVEFTGTSWNVLVNGKSAAVIKREKGIPPPSFNHLGAYLNRGTPLEHLAFSGKLASSEDITVPTELTLKSSHPNDIKKDVEKTATTEPINKPDVNGEDTVADAKDPKASGGIKEEPKALVDKEIETKKVPEQKFTVVGRTYKLIVGAHFKPKLVTGLKLKAGTWIRIKADGKWRHDNSAPIVDAEGELETKYGGHPRMALMMKSVLGEAVVKVGKEWHGQWQGNGSIYCYPNANMNVATKSRQGDVTLYIQILKPIPIDPKK